MNQPPETGPAPADLPSREATESQLHLDRAEQIRDISLRLVEQAQREILILSRDLDPDYYDQVPFLDALRRLALEVPHWPVRVLLLDVHRPVVLGHPLIALARRLTSRIAIRRLGEEFRERPDAFLIVDSRGYCLRRLADTREAVASLDGPREARLLRADFETLWEHSEGDIELRQLP